MTQVLTFNGIDASNEISLLEYGLLVSNETHEDGSGSHFCIFRVGDGFDYGHIYPNDIANLINGNEWLSNEDVNKFIEFTGCSDTIEFLNLPLVQQLNDLLSYYGPMEIMGSYGSPTITKQEAIQNYL